MINQFHFCSTREKLFFLIYLQVFLVTFITMIILVLIGPFTDISFFNFKRFISAINNLISAVVTTCEVSRRSHLLNLGPYSLQ